MFELLRFADIHRKPLLGNHSLITSGVQIAYYNLNEGYKNHTRCISICREARLPSRQCTCRRF